MNNNIIYIYEEKQLWKNIIIKLLIITMVSLYMIFVLKVKSKLNQLINFGQINSVDDFINNLNNYSIYREPQYILLFDYIYSPICEDFNAYTIFKYYQENKINNAYYILNEGTELYKSLLLQNKAKNIIPYKNKKLNSHLFPFLLNSKIIP